MHSIEREGDNVVAAAKVDLGVAARADYDILLAAHHVGRGWRIDTCTGAEVPQLLAVGRIVGSELAVAFTRENETARGGENAADHRLRRLDLPFYFAVVVVNRGNVARLRLARDHLEGATKPQLAIRIRRVLDLVGHRLVQVNGICHTPARGGRAR